VARLRLAAAAVLLAFLASGCATLWPERFDPCRRDAGQTACFVRHQQEYLAVWGLVPAASLRDRGIELRRAMFRDGYNRFLPAVELSRRPGGQPVVSVYLPRPGSETGPALPAMTTPVPVADWDSLSGSGAGFDRRPAPPLSRVVGENITVCGDSWLIIVEYADPSARQGRRLRRRVENGCFESGAADYANRLASVAVQALPHCAAIEVDLGPARTLSICATFSGDRTAAAAAYNRFVLMEDVHRADIPAVRTLFRNGATLEWSGYPAVRERAAARDWVERTFALHADPLLDSIVGEGPGRAVLRGVLRRWAEDQAPDGAWLQAPLEILWVREGTEPFRIAHIAVGAFEPLPGLCPPGLLTGAERANNCHR
jgi:hypothetical protein